METIAELLERQGVVFTDVTRDVKMLLLGYTIGRSTPPWTYATLERLVATFFPVP